jgi:hypothetical protein
MTVGTVKWFNADKGFDFIPPSPAWTSSCIQRDPVDWLPLT